MSTRRWLLKGFALDHLQKSLAAYETLGPRGPSVSFLPVRGPDEAGWIEVEVGPEVPLYHFLNAAVWFQGVEAGDPRPETTLLVDQEAAAPYWLKPAPELQGGSVLHGSRDDLRPFVYDLARMGEVEAEEWQTAALSIKLAMMTHQVPLAWQEPAQLRPISTHLEWRPWRLDAPRAHPLVQRVADWLLGKR
jgi:hypothetical protein